MSYGKKEEERRTKQSIDSPQTIEANNNLAMASNNESLFRRELNLVL